MTTSLQEIREEWYEYLRSIVKNRDYIPEDCIDGAGDWWLSLIKERDAELVVQIKKMKILEIGLLDENENGYNKAIKDVLLLLTTTPTEGGEMK